MLTVPLALTIALSSGTVATLAQAPTPVPRSTNQQIVLSYFRDVLDGRRIDLLDKLFHPDCVISRPEGTLNGLAGIRGVVERPNP